jgi:hypothetical protein
MAHEISDFIDAVKESLTDGQYKEGMELCQKIFQKKESEKKIFRMTYLRPYSFLDNHCDEEDCDEMKYLVAFQKVTGLVELTEGRAEKIRSSGCFIGTKEEMDVFIELDVLKSFPHDVEDLGSELQWFEFPVLSLHPLECPSS